MLRPFHRVQQFWKQLDPDSLQFRLTAGVTAVSILGITGVALWTTWRTQQILIVSRQHDTEAIAQRLPRDVELYSEMMSPMAALQKAIDNRTLSTLFLVVRDAEGNVIAQSGEPWQDDQSTISAILAQAPQVTKSQVLWIEEHFFVLCSTPITINRSTMGTLHVAQDITTDQIMYGAVIRSLGIASLLSILLITLAIAFYVRRSLRPLMRVCHQMGTVSAQTLNQAALKPEQAPTEVRELIKTYDKMLMRLSESWDQQRQFFNDVSHELRTPLTIVSGYLQSTLRRCNTLTEPQREALEIAASEADRTIQLLQDLLALARADSGHIHLNSETLVLNDVALEVVGMAEKYSGDRPIIIAAHSEPILVWADRDRLKQALLNLVDNALKYSEPDQPVEIELSRTAEGAKIQVSDRGCGIPLQHQNRIFDRFYRVDEARARSTGGYGLGLSIVKTLIESMGGSISLYSQLDMGTTFTITLPSPSV